ncbi:MAG: MBL fold metallo-hydrolase [Candidatus Bathyarchaeota archaeon]|nr:MBL fold metallo-hydrolase [Candidatus Bathyarchaeota archaeon]
MTKMFAVGMYLANCYVVHCKDTLQAAVIDPGFGSAEEAQELLTHIETNDLELKFIINTHGHPDHTCGNQLLKDRFRIPICVHEDDAYMLGESGWETARYFGFEKVSPPADVLLHEGSYIKIGDVTLRVIHTPGHSFGSIVLLGETEVFTGDTLFAGSIGRTDFPASSDREMQKSLRKLLTLQDYFVVYPGHGPTTTIGEEKRVNPFLRML